VGDIALGAGALARTVQDENRERISVLGFIPSSLWAGIRAATNTTDLRDYIESAINSRSGDALLEVIFPPGSYFVAGPVRIYRNNLNIIGQRAGLSSNSATANIIEVGDGITTRSNVDVIGMTFEKTVVSTGGFCVKHNYTTNSRVERCVFYGNNKMFGGVWALSTTRVKVINCDGENFAAGGKGVLWQGTAAHQSIDLHVRDCEFYTIATGIGVDVQDYCNGFYCRQNTFFACGSAGISMAASVLANAMFSAKVDLNDFDSCGFGIYSQWFRNVSVSTNWFSANTNTNIQISGGCSSWIVNGNQLYGNGRIGVNIQGTSILLSGNGITACTDGVVGTAGATDITLTGNAISGNSGYGVNLLGAPANVTVVGNTVRSNTAGQVTTGATNSNIANNLIT
jgi:parallel beta-helix repeat protein